MISVRRIVLLAVTGVSLYLVAPALLDTFSSWERLATWPGPVALIVALEFASLGRAACFNGSRGSGRGGSRW